mmetsp:Transcript_10705/g.25387  ORF Transcript_10705/g.25387 Transcript_10705/m.25387 type:complete len:326 (-) Transcript_10705:683-1660(-)
MVGVFPVLVLGPRCELDPAATVAAFLRLLLLWRGFQLLLLLLILLILVIEVVEASKLDKRRSRLLRLCWLVLRLLGKFRLLVRPVLFALLLLLLLGWLWRRFVLAIVTIVVLLVEVVKRRPQLHKRRSWRHLLLGLIFVASLRREVDPSLFLFLLLLGILSLVLAALLGLGLLGWRRLRRLCILPLVLVLVLVEVVKGSPKTDVRRPWSLCLVLFVRALGAGVEVHPALLGLTAFGRWGGLVRVLLVLLKHRIKADTLLDKRRVRDLALLGRVRLLVLLEADLLLQPPVLGLRLGLREPGPALLLPLGGGSAVRGIRLGGRRHRA